MQPVEWVAAVLGAIAVWLTVKQRIWCWPVGIACVALYVLVFFRARLYADMTLQLIYIPLQLYGWTVWTRGGSDHEVLRVSRAARGMLVTLAAASALLSVVTGYLLRNWTDAALPYWDCTILALSLAGQYLQSLKKIENWLVWIVVDFLSVGVFAVRELYPTMGLYAVFLVMAPLGFIEWRKELPTAGITERAP